MYNNSIDDNYKIVAKEDSVYNYYRHINEINGSSVYIKFYKSYGVVSAEVITSEEFESVSSNETTVEWNGVQIPKEIMDILLK